MSYAGTNKLLSVGKQQLLKGLNKKSEKFLFNKLEITPRRVISDQNVIQPKCTNLSAVQRLCPTIRDFSMPLRMSKESPKVTPKFPDNTKKSISQIVAGNAKWFTELPKKQEKPSIYKRNVLSATQNAKLAVNKEKVDAKTLKNTVSVCNLLTLQQDKKNKLKSKPLSTIDEVKPIPPTNVAKKDSTAISENKNKSTLAISATQFLYNRAYIMRKEAIENAYKLPLMKYKAKNNEEKILATVPIEEPVSSVPLEADDKKPETEDKGKVESDYKDAGIRKLFKQYGICNNSQGFLVPKNTIKLSSNSYCSLAGDKNISNNQSLITKVNSEFERHIFSGIQPTGNLHIGNYFGAIKQWINLQEIEKHMTSYCIVDLHSITLPQNSETLRRYIFQVAANLIACGLDPIKCNLFVQSDVKEHTELCWILSTLTTMARLGHLPQYKEKSKALKDIPLGLFIYPVLQAADILLYRATHVPVGEDQLQHIQLAQHLARLFNGRYGNTFPICHAMMEDRTAARIRSLREPTKKMSKSDADTRATIFLTDHPDVIMDKVKKAVTDFTSDVYYDDEYRPGVSNLIAIHALITNTTIDQVVYEAKSLDTGTYKLRIAEALIEYLKPIRLSVDQQLSHPRDLADILIAGAEKARTIAAENMAIVKNKVGLGAIESWTFNLEKKDRV